MLNRDFQCGTGRGRQISKPDIPIYQSTEPRNWHIFFFTGYEAMDLLFLFISHLYIGFPRANQGFSMWYRGGTHP